MLTFLKRIGKLALLAALCIPLVVMINFTVQQERRDRAAWGKYLETQRQIVKNLEQAQILAQERDRLKREIRDLERRYQTRGVKR